GPGLGVSSWHPSGGRTLRCLAGLLADVLVLVADPLALVGLGLADLPDVGRDLPHELLVVAPHHDLGRRRGLELDPLDRGHRDRVREPHLDFERLALERRAVADADDREPLLVALRAAPALCA